MLTAWVGAYCLTSEAAAQHHTSNITCVLQERASGMYRLSAFYFARLASDLPMDMAIPTVRPPPLPLYLPAPPFYLCSELLLPRGVAAGVGSSRQ